MNSKQIIGHIMAATGQSISSLALKSGYTKQALYDVIKGRTRTQHLRDLVSSITKLPICDLWPGSPPAGVLTCGVNGDKNKIKAIMKGVGITQTQIAEFLGVSVVAVHHVVSGKKKTPRLRRGIAFLLSKPVSELWPDESPVESQEAA